MADPLGAQRRLNRCRCQCGSGTNGCGMRQCISFCKVLGSMLLAFIRSTNGAWEALFLFSVTSAIGLRDYQENVRRLSAIVKDKPRSSLDNAVWWTEYVLRHKGAAHLRTAAVDMPWYQYLLLDVVAFLIVSALLAVWLLWRLAAFVYSRLVHPTTCKIKKNTACYTLWTCRGTSTCSWM
ncbi:hypothetical protein PR048_004082 [Dryococelus australis]|uniref:Uncharacterized protein n=1 Tax=Dryococelus australis TaxID=614101 RepID=A0ABQ9I4I9_9NEOP|nr:hypothetical protein PR048_004082 [Dryococelus australis]